MTAARAGSIAAEGFWLTLRRVRDQWVLLVFLATALFWIRDLYERFVDLPEHVSELHAAIGSLRVDIARLEARPLVPPRDRSRALVFSDLGHSIGDGRPGTPVTARFALAHQVRDDCRPSDLAAFMIDAHGRWLSVATGLSRLPRLTKPQDLAFTAMVHPEMAVGRAQFLVQVTQDCGSHVQVDSSPRLQFRVLPER